MADNTVLNSGSGGDTIATDDVGGVKYQRVKIDCGADGAASALVRGQQTKANSLPVTLASDEDEVAVADSAVATAVAAVETAVDNSALPVGAGTAAAAGRVTLASDDPAVAHLATVKSPGLGASATFTPAAASHTANDCNGAAGTFSLGAISASRVMITDVSLEIDGGTAEATAWRLYLYNVTPPSGIADDGAFDLGSGDRASFLGYIDLGTAVDLGSTQWVQQSGINRIIKLAGTSVFGYLVNLTTLTPANVAHIVTLTAVQM